MNRDECDVGRDFTPDGLTHLLEKDIPPRSNAAELRVERPQIDYGELAGDPAVVTGREPEFDPRAAQPLE